MLMQIRNVHLAKSNYTFSFHLLLDVLWDSMQQVTSSLRDPMLSCLFSSLTMHVLFVSSLASNVDVP